jgi:hypothetical protein
VKGIAERYAFGSEQIDEYTMRYLKTSPNLSETRMVWLSWLNTTAVDFLGNSLYIKSEYRLICENFDIPCVQESEAGTIDAPQFENFVISCRGKVTSGTVHRCTAHRPRLRLEQYIPVISRQSSC